MISSSVPTGGEPLDGIFWDESGQDDGRPGNERDGGAQRFLSAIFHNKSTGRTPEAQWVGFDRQWGNDFLPELNVDGAFRMSRATAAEAFISGAGKTQVVGFAFCFWG